MRRNRIRKELSMIPPKPCIFCGAPSGSLEDIIANWILDVAQIKGRRVTLGFVMRFANGGTEWVTEERPIEEILLLSVCGKCNNEWMSGLERTTKPLLQDLLAPTWPANHRDLIAHIGTSTHRYGLGIWAMKTACTFGEKMSVKVPRDFVTRLKDGNEFEMQPGVRLQLALSEESGLAAHMTNHCRLYEASDGKIEQRLNDSSFVLILQINHLILRFWHCPFTIRQQMNKRNPVEIYPTFFMPPESFGSRNGVLANRVGYLYDSFQQFDREVFHVRVPVPAVSRCEVDLLP